MTQLTCFLSLRRICCHLQVSSDPDFQLSDKLKENIMQSLAFTHCFTNFTVCYSNRSCTTRNAHCFFLFLKLRSHLIKACQLEGQWHPACALWKRGWLSHRHSNHLWILLSCRKGWAVVASYNQSQYSLPMLFARWFLYFLFFLQLHKFKLNLSPFSAGCR